MQLQLPTIVFALLALTGSHHHAFADDDDRIIADSSTDVECLRDNLGYGFSEATHNPSLGESHYGQAADGSEMCYPKVHSLGSGVSGFDDSVAVLVGGNFNGLKGAEIEGNMVVMGNFNVEQNGPLNFASAGEGTQITPQKGGECIKVGGDMSSAKRLEVLYPSYECTAVVKGQRNDYNTIAPNWMTDSGFVYTQDPNLDLSEYEDTIDELKAKSAYWASLPTTSGASTNVSSQAFNIECTEDDVVQVFNVDAASVNGQGYSSYVFNENCSDKTVLINVQGGGSVTFTTKHMKWTNKDGQVQSGGWANFPSCMNSAILWNFPNAIDVLINGSDEVQGSLLVTGNLEFQTSGQSGRTMVLGDLTQNAWGSEFHSFDFNPPTPLPDRHCEEPEVLPEFPEVPPPEAATGSPQQTEAPTLSSSSSSASDCLQLMAPIWKETIGNVDDYPYMKETVQILSQDDVTVTFTVNQLLMTEGTPMMAVHYRDVNSSDEEVCDMNASGKDLIAFNSAQEYTAQCTYGYADIGVYSYVGPQDEFNEEECEACAAPDSNYVGYYISVPCVPLCQPTIPPTTTEQTIPPSSSSTSDCLQLMAPIWKETIGNVDDYPYVRETVQILSQDDVTVTFNVNQLFMTEGTPMMAVHYRDVNNENGDEVCDMNASGKDLIALNSAQEYTAQCTYGYADIGVYSYVGPKEDFNEEECEACAAPDNNYVGYYISVPCVPLCQPTIPPATIELTIPPTTTTTEEEAQVDCLGEIIETSSVTSLDFSTSTVTTNTLHEEGGELRYEDIGVVRDRAVSLVVTVASGDYTDIAEVWDDRERDPDLMNGKNGNFANINLQTVEGKPKSGEGNFKFCFHDTETNDIVTVDRFSFTVFDNDIRTGGIEEKMLLDATTAQSFQLWPDTENSQVKLSCEDGSTNIPCEAGVRTIFHSSTIGYLDDNPTDPNDMNDLQKSRSIAFQFTDTDCFEFTYDHYCPSEQIDGGTPCEGYTGGNFLFGGSASEIITDGECVVTPTLAPTAEPTNELTVAPTTKEPTETPTLAPTAEPTDAPTVAPTTKEPTDTPTTAATTTAPTTNPTFHPTAMTEPPIVTNGADDDTTDDTFLLPFCPDDITLVVTNGVTEWPTTENKPVVEIIRQETSTVTVGLNQAWTSGQQSIDAIFYSYKESIWSEKCYEEEDVASNAMFDTITIQCNVLSPYAHLQICVVDDANKGILGATDDATIPKCCHSEESILPNTPTVCYSLEIRCDSLCVEEDSRKLLRGSK